MSLLLQQVLNDIYDNEENIYNNSNCFEDVGRDINGNIYIENKRDIKGNMIKAKTISNNKKNINSINKENTKKEKIKEYNPIMTEKESKIFNQLIKKHNNI